MHNHIHSLGFLLHLAAQLLSCWTTAAAIKWAFTKSPLARLKEYLNQLKSFFVFSFSLSCSAMMNIHFCSCNYDVGRTKLSTPLFYDWLFSSVLLLSCCAPNLLRLALFAIILPLLFPKLKSQHSASFILRTCWQPTANSSNIPVIYLWWNPLRSCARRQIVCHHHCLPIFHADRENRAERGQQTHTATLD